MEENNSNIVSEPVAVGLTNSYVDVMTMLHTMPITRKVKQQVAIRLVKELSEPSLSNAFDRLDELSHLQDGWAGEGSYAISRQVINNLKSVLLISEDEDWRGWMIGPDVNATIGLQSKSSDGSISVGTGEFSYYAEIDGQEIHASHVPFTPEALLAVMRKIA